MTRVKVLVVEDDSLYAIELEKILEEMDHEIVEVTDNSAEALQLLQTREIDLVLMDINIKGSLNGIELAEKFGEQGIPVIFLTVFDDQQTYLSARKIIPHAYLIKPVHRINLQSSIDSLLQRQREPALSAGSFRLWEDDLEIYNNLFIKSQHKMIRVNSSDIFLVEAEGNYCVIYTEAAKHVVKLSLRRIKQKLSSKKFKQIHRNYVVQTSKIKDLDLKENTVRILDRSVPVGQRYKLDFLRQLNKLE